MQGICPPLSAHACKPGLAVVIPCHVKGQLACRNLCILLAVPQISAAVLYHPAAGRRGKFIIPHVIPDAGSFLVLSRIFSFCGQHCVKQDGIFDIARRIRPYSLQPVVVFFAGSAADVRPVHLFNLISRHGWLVGGEVLLLPAVDSVVYVVRKGGL